MSARLPTLAAVLAAAGLLGWLAVRAPDASTADSSIPDETPEPGGDAPLQSRGGGSEVPCDVPLAWRVARVDPEFGLAVDEAAEIIREAATLWEDGTGRDLFEHVPDTGFPLRLVFDERQARAAQRAGRQQELDDLRADIVADQSALTERSNRLSEATARYLARTEDLDRRVAEHNAAVRAWNESSDRSAEPGRALEAVGAELREEQDELAADRPALDAERAALQTAEEELNERIAEYERRATELEGALPPEEVEAGEYREEVTRQDGAIVSVSREIRLYRFVDSSELRLLAAHELGHALGLGHSDDPIGVMNARARADQPVAALAESDLELFRIVCAAEGTDGGPNR